MEIYQKLINSSSATILKALNSTHLHTSKHTQRFEIDELTFGIPVALMR